MTALPKLLDELDALYQESGRGPYEKARYRAALVNAYPALRAAARDAERYLTKKTMNWNKYVERRPFTEPPTAAEKLAWGISYDAAIDAAAKEQDGKGEK